LEQAILPKQRRALSQKFTNHCIGRGRGKTLAIRFHLTSASALPEETGNLEIASFHLNAACFLPKTHEIHFEISPGHRFTVKTINCMHQIGPRKGNSILQYVTPTLHVSLCQSMCQKWELFLSSMECKLMNSIAGISYYINK